MSIESIYEAVEKEYNNLYRDSSLKTPYNGFQGICNAICNNWLNEPFESIRYLMIITKGLIMSASDFHHVVSSYRSNLNVLPYLSDEIKEFYKLSLEIFNIAKEYCYDNSDFVESNINFIQSCLKRMKGLYKKIKSTSYIVSLPYNCKEELLKVCNIEILVCEADISLIETNDKSFISSRMSAVYCIKGLRKNSKIDFSEINEVSSNFASKLIDSYLPDTLLEQNIVASN